MIDDQALFESFVEESRQHLQNLEPDLLELEKSGGKVDPEVVNRAFRSIHSIKGASGFLGLSKIGELSHTMENLMSLLRDGKISVSPGFTDTLLSGVDTLKTMVEDVAGSETYNIENDLDRLRVLLDSLNQQINVKNEEKSSPKKQTYSSEIENVKSKFGINDDIISGIVKRGHFLYSVSIKLHEDLQYKDRTPFEYISEMQKLGDFVESQLSI